MDEHLETVIARAEKLAERVAVLEERSLRASRNLALQMIETNILRAEVYLDASPEAMAVRMHMRESSAAVEERIKTSEFPEGDAIEWLSGEIAFLKSKGLPAVLGDAVYL